MLAQAAQLGRAGPVMVLSSATSRLGAARPFGLARRLAAQPAAGGAARHSLAARAEGRRSVHVAVVSRLGAPVVQCMAQRPAAAAAAAAPPVPAPPAAASLRRPSSPAAESMVPLNCPPVQAMTDASSAAAEAPEAGEATEPVALAEVVGALDAALAAGEPESSDVEDGLLGDTPAGFAATPRSFASLYTSDEDEEAAPVDPSLMLVNCGLSDDTVSAERAAGRLLAECSRSRRPRCHASAWRINRTPRPTAGPTPTARPPAPRRCAHWRLAASPPSSPSRRRCLSRPWRATTSSPAPRPAAVRGAALRRAGRAGRGAPHCVPAAQRRRAHAALPSQPC